MHELLTRDEVETRPLRDVEGVCFVGGNLSAVVANHFLCRAKVTKEGQIVPRKEGV